MIKINLLPEELRRIERARRIKLNIAVLTAAVVVVAVLLAGVALYGVGRRLSRIAADKARLQKLSPLRAEGEALMKEKQELGKEIEMLDRFTSSKILWSTRLNEISDAIPSELFLVKLGYSSQQPQCLTIKGETVIGGGLGNIVEFIDSLRKTPDFINVFPEISYSIESREDGRKSFELKCARVKTEAVK